MSCGSAWGCGGADTGDLDDGKGRLGGMGRERWTGDPRVEEVVIVVVVVVVRGGNVYGLSL